ncbi:MAG: VOC family protein [Actinomycetales bacterium]|nr:VOC family protein [Actinomycetales bacterium]
MPPRLQISTVSLSAATVADLSRFYADLLGYAVDDGDPGWHYLQAPDGSVALSVQHEPTHRPPAWPQTGQVQQMQAHLEIRVDGDLDAALERAVALGATVATHQPQADVRVLLDPAGHPFCLWVVS